jgi:hypothetical protein
VRSAEFLSTTDKVEKVITQLDGAYYRLVLVAGPARSGKTRALSALTLRRQWPRINVNMEVSEKLLELTQRQRAVRIVGILEDIVGQNSESVILLDNIEILFAEALSQDPLRLLQNLARNRAIVAAWPGMFDGTHLFYAEPGHTEFRRYPRPQVSVISVDAAASADPT